MYSAIIVDDYQVYRKEISSMSVWGEVSGFEIAEEAADGLEALNKLRQHPVDLLVTDIRMPLINGLELLKKATEERLCDCVILMSQFGDFEYARQGLSNGAFEYLLKPIDPAELLRVLLRARNYISERHLEISKINYVDNIIKKTSEEYFPAAELDNIMNLISEGRLEASEAASYLVDITYSEINYDIVKTAQIISLSLKRILDWLPDEFPWINRFLNLQDIKISDFSKLDDISLIKEAFFNKVDIILSTIRKFELDIESNGLVRMTCKTILENIDTDIKTNEIANMLFITRTYLSQFFKEKTGMNLIKYMTDVKIERAKVLISRGINNSEISEILGYQDDEYFKRLFKKVTGMTINEYKSINVVDKHSADSPTFCRRSKPSK